MIQLIYTLILYPCLHFIFFLLSFSNEKIKRGFEIRKNRPWLGKIPMPTPPNGKWIWFHVASGEFEYAKPVIKELKKETDHKILVTYFSPSVMNAIAHFAEVDFAVPMPWDTPWDWNAFLDHFQPAVLAIARTDTWPNMIWQTHKKKIPSLLFSATLPAQSNRVASPWGRFFYGNVVKNLTAVSCVSEEDAHHFRMLDPGLKISVDGDTRFDQVIARIKNPKPISLVKSDSRAFVAGSTWPEDEEILFPALGKPVAQGLSVLIAPHEPTPSHLDKMKSALTSFGIPFKSYSELPEGTALEKGSVILIDKVGILADLYSLSFISFVGGSFKKSVHSVMEPAAAGNFTFVGPYHLNSREAISLKKSGFLGEIRSSHEFEKKLLEELSLSDEKIEARRRHIQNFVEKNAGVSFKISQWIKANEGKS